MISWATVFILSVNLMTSESSSPLQQTLIEGLQLISQLLHPGESSPISQFFSFIQQSFLQNNKQPKGEENEGASSGIWSSLFQNLGLQAKQTPTVALNLIIFLAQMVGNAFPSKPSGTTTKRSQSIFEKVLSQPQVNRMLSGMQDPSLMEEVLLEVERKLSPAPSFDCVMQLLCRTAPIVQGMQTSLTFFLDQSTSDPKRGPSRGEDMDERDAGRENDSELMLSEWNKESPIKRFFFFMPGIPDFISKGDYCRRKYPKC